MPFFRLNASDATRLLDLAAAVLLARYLRPQLCPRQRRCVLHRPRTCSRLLSLLRPRNQPLFSSPSERSSHPPHGHRTTSLLPSGCPAGHLIGEPPIDSTFYPGLIACDVQASSLANRFPPQQSAVTRRTIAPAVYLRRASGAASGAHRRVRDGRCSIHVHVQPLPPPLNARPPDA